jgi:hypothetical protein
MHDPTVKSNCLQNSIKKIPQFTINICKLCNKATLSCQTHVSYYVLNCVFDSGGISSRFDLNSPSLENTSTFVVASLRPRWVREIQKSRTKMSYFSSLKPDFPSLFPRVCAVTTASSLTIKGVTNERRCKLVWWSILK